MRWSAYDEDSRVFYFGGAGTMCIFVPLYCSLRKASYYVTSSKISVPLTWRIIPLTSVSWEEQVWRRFWLKNCKSHILKDHVSVGLVFFTLIHRVFLITPMAQCTYQNSTSLVASWKLSGDPNEQVNLFSRVALFLGYLTLTSF